MTNRITSLSVATQGAEEWLRLYQDLSELAVSLGAVHSHVSVSATVVEEDDSEPKCDPDGLYYDEFTIHKVRLAIRKGAIHLRDSELNDIIAELQNAGILFRERPRR